MNRHRYRTDEGTKIMIVQVLKDFPEGLDVKKIREEVLKRVSEGCRVEKISRYRWLLTVLQKEGKVKKTEFIYTLK